MTAPPDRAVQLQLQQVTELLQRGQLQAAQQACSALLAKWPEQAAAVHLMGLIREQAGDSDGGERLLRHSLTLEPGNAHFHLNLANLLRRRGRFAEAEAAFRQVLVLAPRERNARHGLALTLVDLGEQAAAEAECRALIRSNASDAVAWKLLAFLLSNQNRLLESESAYRRALALDTQDALAHHNLGSVLSRLERAEQALESLDRAQSLGLAGFELLFNRGRTLALLYRLDEAEREFAAAVALQPRHTDAQVNLARLRYMRGDADFARSFAAVAAAQPDDLVLQASYTVVLRCAGQWEAAEKQVRELLRHHGPLPELRSVLAQVLHEAGRAQDAEVEALAAAAARPTDQGIIENLVLILLSRGRAAEAMQYIVAQRERNPLGQNWIAYEATAARLLGRHEYLALYDYDRLIRTYEPEAPRGWASMRELNGDLLAALQARHRFAAHPLDQSLRNGSQTTRNLLAEGDQTIQAALAAFAEPLRDYTAAIGSSASQPLASRNTGAAEIVGAWSVQLRREGFHVNHMHPAGWISSAYYVDLPDEVRDATLRSGWIKFGEPRFSVPGAGPERFVQPRPGLLVLFPSYMWHGTNPIHGEQPRTTIAFDALPVAAN